MNYKIIGDKVELELKDFAKLLSMIVTLSMEQHK